MLNTIRKLVRIAYGDDLPPVERWALRHKDRASPDEIVVAAIIQSFGKNPESWIDVSVMKRVAPLDARRLGIIEEVEAVSLTNGIVKIVSDPVVKSRDNDGIGPWIKVGEGILSVDGLELDRLNSKRVLQAWNNAKTVRERAETVAAKAKADMERNEKAWNLAERLLGMKRNEHGALVPVNTVEEA